MRPVAGLLLAGLLLTCTKDHTTGPSANVALIVLSPAFVSLFPGDSATLYVRTVDATGADVPVAGNIAWVSSAPGIATVSYLGTVVGRQQGVANITVTVGTLTASIEVAVLLDPIAAVKISSPPPVLVVGDAAQLSVRAITASGRDGIGVQPQWSSILPTTATVNSAGVVVARAAGLARIAATVGAIADTVTLTVTSVDSTVVTVSTSEIGGVGLTLQSSFSGTAVSAGGATAAVVSSLTSQVLAAVDNSGVLRGLAVTAPGNTTGVLAVDAASTAASLIFLSSGITTTEPALAALRLQAIRGLGCFGSFAAYLRTRLPSSGVREVMATGAASSQMATCLQEYSSGNPSLRARSARVAALSLNQSAASSQSASVAAQRSFPGGANGVDALINSGWRNVSIWEIVVHSNGVTRARLITASMGGYSPGYLQLTAGAPNSETFPVPMPIAGDVTRTEIWVVGWGGADNGIVDVPSAIRQHPAFLSALGASYKDTYWNYLIKPLLGMWPGAGSLPDFKDFAFAILDGGDAWYRLTAAVRAGDWAQVTSLGTQYINALRSALVAAGAKENVFAQILDAVDNGLNIQHFVTNVAWFEPSYDRIVVPSSFGSVGAVYGDNQMGQAGATLPTRVGVRVVSYSGAPISGARVRFSSEDGGVAQTPLISTDANGDATTAWQLANRAGTQRLNATVVSGANAQMEATGSPRVFTATVAGSATPASSLSANPTSITAGQISTLTWSSTDATSCTATWTGSTLATSGSTTVSPATTTTYTVTCSGASASATVTVATSVPVPVVNSLSPTTMAANGVGQQLTIVGSNFQNGNWVQFSYGVGSNAGVWVNGLSNPPTIANAGQMSIGINPGTATDVINVRVCRSSSQTTTGDCSSGAQSVAVTAATATASLSANPTSLTEGQSSTLTWSSTNATSCTGTWTGSALATSGSTTVSPTTTTTFEVTCSGASATAMVTVTAAASPTATTQAATNVTQTSVRMNGSVNPSGVSTSGYFEWGTSSTLSTFNTSSPFSAGSGTSAVAIQLDLSNLSCGVTYYFRAVASNANGVTVKGNILSVTLSACAAPTATLTANPTSLTAGQSSTLTWGSTSTSACNGSPWTSSTATSGSQSVQPTATTTYTISCQGLNGTPVTASATITVGAAVPVPTVMLTANPTSITSGQSSTLSWTSTDATQCVATWGAGGNGAVAVSGTQVVSPSATTTYAIVCGNAGPATASATATVTVTAAAFPTATTQAATNVTQTSVRMNGSVNPSGVSTSGYFEWGTSSTLGTFNTSSPFSAGADTSAVVIALDLSNLSCGVTYYFRAVATNANGVTVKGTILSVTLSACAAPTVTLTANPSSIMAGQSSTLTWSSTNTSACNGSPWTSSTATSGSQSVQPAATTTYTIACQGLNGTPVTASATVTVGAAVPVPTVTLTANPPSITSGQSSTLSWSSTNATQCVATWGAGGNGPVAVSGTQVVSPNATTTYAIVCGNEGSATASATATVTVTTAATPTATTLAATNVTQTSLRMNGSGNPNGGGTNGFFQWGLSATLSDGTFTISQALGAGTSAVPYSTDLTGRTCGTTYYYRAVVQATSGNTIPRYGSTVSATTATCAAPTVTLTANPASITAGQSSTLAWSSTSTSACNGSPWTNSTATSGSQSVQPAATTTYTIACQGLNGTPVTASATVTVGAAVPVPTVTLTANPTSITSGQSSTLSWSSTNATQCVATWGAGGNGPVAVSGTQIVSPSATMTYAIVCGNAGPATASATATVTVTAAAPPTATTLAATNVTRTGFQMNGSANPNGVSTSVYMEWSYTSSTLSNPNVTSPLSIGTSATSFYYTLSGGLCNTTYYYRTVAVNANGAVARGSIISVRTLAC